MASMLNNLWVSSFFPLNAGRRWGSQVTVSSLNGGISAIASPSLVLGDGVSFGENDRVGSLVNFENGWSGCKVEENKEKDVPETLEPLWDDGYGTRSVKDFCVLANKIIKPDGGPPRWFCPVSCGKPRKDSPILLFLPGIDGLGLGLILHEKALGKFFEVRCLHIPVQDRTPFKDLVKYVEETVRLEQASCPNRPIYLVGDSFGGCLALAVASRNPTTDLVVILANPATSFENSQLQPLLPFLEALPDAFHGTFPYLFSFSVGDTMKMAMVGIKSRHPSVFLEQLAGNLKNMLLCLPGLADIMPKDTFIWKLKLLKQAAAYANSRLHAITAEVLVLASGKDGILPSKDEAQRLSCSLQNCRTCFFPDNGHTILLEYGVNLLTVIKGTCKYRSSSRHDFIKDFLPPSMSEYRSFVEGSWWYRLATSPVMLSTLEDGKIVRGLAGVPNEGPVLLVGYHMLMGLELAPLVSEFLREKKILVRGVAHPEIFSEQSSKQLHASMLFDLMRVFGALPVSASNLFKLLSTKSYVLLYPGGAREALHRKGEAYKLFWPDSQEFVRMAAKFGATIVPFGAVGEDDIAELVLDYNDMMKIPILSDYIRESNEGRTRLRAELDGEVANQDIFFPGFLPKFPGRFYYLFGKPIRTKGMEDMLKDRENAKELYLHIKYKVEESIAYLIKKREEDPYRGFLERAVYEASYAPLEQVPTFRP